MNTMNFAVRTQQKKLMGPILSLYYEESLVSSNLNSKLLWFHSVRPNIHSWTTCFINSCDVHPQIFKPFAATALM